MSSSGSTPIISSRNDSIELAAKQLRVIWGVWRSGVPHAPRRAGGLQRQPRSGPDRARDGFPGEQEARGTYVGGLRRRTLRRGTGAPLPLSGARTGPGGSLGQRGDRMAPLRWGMRDHHGAASGNDGRRHGRVAVRTPHRRDDFILTRTRRRVPYCRAPAAPGSHARGARAAPAVVLDADH